MNYFGDSGKITYEELRERKINPQPQKQITLRGIKETLSKVFRKEKGERE